LGLKKSSRSSPSAVAISNQKEEERKKTYKNYRQASHFSGNSPPGSWPAVVAAFLSFQKQFKT
jgi:hypothetical protein